MRAAVIQAGKQAEAAGSPENAKALSDGVLTTTEYYASGHRYASCFADFGVDVQGPYLDPIDNVTFDWYYPASIGELKGIAKQAARCQRQWQPVQTAYKDTHAPHMDRALLQAVRECMATRGISASASARDVSDLVGAESGSNAKHADIVEQCTYSQAKRLFPQNPSFTFSY